MALIERVRAHFKSLVTEAIEVPEWGENGQPAKIFYTPITLAERQRFHTAGENEGPIAAYAEVLFVKALDETGKQHFTLDDKVWLRKQADPDVVRRVALQLMVVPTVADMGKGSSRTGASA